MQLVIAVGIFIVILLSIEGAYFALRNPQSPQKKEVKKRLKSLSSSGYGDENIDILRKRQLSGIPWFNRLLLKFRWTGRMRFVMEQAGIERPLGLFISLSFLLAGIGYLGGLWMTSNRLVSIFAAICLGLIPFYYIHSKKKKRMLKFQAQLPDALDMIARALKAGQAFSSGLKMVADELDDPIGVEFAETLSQINFGVAVNDALKSLSKRVECPDLKFFVISVIIQRETGGNLAEILEKIAHLIRERFRFQGHIRVLSSQARLSALILIALPFVVAFATSLLNPGYLQILGTDPIGRILVAVALILMVFGTLTMRRIIAIKV